MPLQGFTACRCIASLPAQPTSFPHNINMALPASMYPHCFWQRRVSKGAPAAVPDCGGQQLCMQHFCWHLRLRATHLASALFDTCIRILSCGTCNHTFIMLGTATRFLSRLASVSSNTNSQCVNGKACPQTMHRGTPKDTYRCRQYCHLPLAGTCLPWILIY